MWMSGPPHPQRCYSGFLNNILCEKKISREFPLTTKGLKTEHPLHRIHPADKNRVAASHLTGPGKPSKPVQKSWRQSFWITSAAAECCLRTTNTDQSLVQARASIPGWVRQLSAGATHLPAGLARPGHAPPTHTQTVQTSEPHARQLQWRELCPGNRKSVSFLSKAKPGIRMWGEEMLAWIHVRLKFRFFYTRLLTKQTESRGKKNSDFNRQQEYKWSM